MKHLFLRLRPKTYLKLFAVVIVICYLTWILQLPSLNSVINNPQVYIRTSIGANFYRVHLFAKEHNELPPSLDILPKRPRHSDSTADFWGHKLIYKVDPEKNIVTIASYGKDGVVGGEGDNADLSKSYYYKTSEGLFFAGQKNWLSTSMVKE